MKAKFCLAALALTGSFVLAIAAEKKTTEKSADPCTAAFEKASLSCTNERANCRARGSDEGTCEKRYTKCVNDAKKAQSDCQNKGKQPATKS